MLRQRTLIYIPPLIVGSSLLVFQTLVPALGPKVGYALAFSLYWLACVLVFALSMGKSNRHGIASAQSALSPVLTRVAIVALLSLPPLIGFLFIYPSTFPDAGQKLSLLFCGIALINGTCEELLWRCVYTNAFPESVRWGILWPSVWFALQQLAPLSVSTRSLPGGALTVGVSALLVGAIWGWVAHRTHNIRWTILSHVLMNATGVGAVVYFAG